MRVRQAEVGAGNHVIKHTARETEAGRKIASSCHKKRETFEDKEGTKTEGAETLNAKTLAIIRGRSCGACGTGYAGTELQILLSKGQEERLSRNRKTSLTMALALEDLLCLLCTEAKHEVGYGRRPLNSSLQSF